MGQSLRVSLLGLRYPFLNQNRTAKSWSTRGALNQPISSPRHCISKVLSSSYEDRTNSYLGISLLGAEALYDQWSTNIGVFPHMLAVLHGDYSNPYDNPFFRTARVRHRLANSAKGYLERRGNSASRSDQLRVLHRKPKATNCLRTPPPKKKKKKSMNKYTILPYN